MSKYRRLACYPEYLPKVFSPNTQLFLTHINEKGNDTLPVLLRNFIPLDEERGANIPEFVNTEAGVVRMIRDGGLANDSYFSLETVRGVYRAACLSGIDYVELGYRNSKKMVWAVRRAIAPSKCW